MKKLLGLLLVFIVLLSLFSGVKKSFIGAKNFFGEYKENILPEDLTGIAKKEQEKEEKDVVVEDNIVKIPYYWKNGVFKEEEDYLSGYIPSIKTFFSEFTTREKILYGTTNSSGKLDLNTIGNLITKTNSVVTKGIYNQSKYFSWDRDSCVIMYNEGLQNNVFVCDSWINWTTFNIENNHFSLTECKLEGETGFCVFLDYLKEYHKWKKTFDTRCMSDENGKYCIFEEYKKLVEEI